MIKNILGRPKTEQHDKTLLPATVVLLCLSLVIGCTNADNSVSATAEPDPAVLEKELQNAFDRMWQNVTLTNAAEYFKTDVSDDFFTIDADGISAGKEELLADTTRLRLLEELAWKFFDQRIKVHGHVGIINGRIQAFSEGKYVAELLYTAVFVKRNSTWMYENWQGTWTKDSPPPPAFMPEDEG